MIHDPHPAARRYILVEESVLPEVFGRVLQAKELLESGGVHSISTAVRQVGLSRSAFYKYKDCVFPARDPRRLQTLQTVLLNEPGALQSLLAQLSEQDANVVTIHQQKPQGGQAQVLLTVDTAAMRTDVYTVLERLRAKPFVRSIELLEE